MNQQGLIRRAATLSYRLLVFAIRRLLRLTQRQPIGRFMVELPAQHMLSLYQSLHPSYDRFLPHLVRQVQGGGTVIDVGANCGDTLAAMVDGNDSLRYVCVEPDEMFFQYLRKNAAAMGAECPAVRIDLCKSLAGKAIVEAVLDGNASTKHAMMGPGLEKAIASKTLDDIARPLMVEQVRLIKSDVDGFDYDVLDSAASLIETHFPMLFFECQIDTDVQRRGYRDAIRSLQLRGYSRWDVFDNFGSWMFATADVELVFGLFEYINGQRTTLLPTIRYVDLLASGDAHLAMITAAVDAHRAAALGGSGEPH